MLLFHHDPILDIPTLLNNLVYPIHESLLVVPKSEFYYISSVAFSFGHPLILDGWAPMVPNYIQLGKVIHIFFMFWQDSKICESDKRSKDMTL